MKDNLILKTLCKGIKIAWSEDGIFKNKMDQFERYFCPDYVQDDWLRSN